MTAMRAKKVATARNAKKAAATPATMPAMKAKKFAAVSQFSLQDVRRQPAREGQGFEVISG
jgi:hypothetical protein